MIYTTPAGADSVGVSGILLALIADVTFNHFIMCCNSNRASYAPISTKADALQFAILVTMDNAGSSGKVNYAEAQKLYDFICQNATFTDDERAAAMKEATSLLNELKEQMAASAKAYANWPSMAHGIVPKDS